MKEEEERKRRVWGVSYKLQITFIPPQKRQDLQPHKDAPH